MSVRVVKMTGEDRGPDMTVAEGIVDDATRAAADRPLGGVLVTEHARSDGTVEMRVQVRPKSQAMLEGLTQALISIVYPDTKDAE